MKFRAVIKQADDWWIGRFVDLSGVNAQEKTKEQLLESLRIGAEDMLSTEIPFEPAMQMTMVEVPEPQWSQAAE